MRLALIAAWLLGVVLIAGLVVYRGAAEVAAVLALTSGSVLWIGAAHLGVLLADSEGWRALLPGLDWRALPKLMVRRWIGISVNTTMPVAQLGGEVVRARLLATAPVTTGARVTAASAAASVLVDVTLGLVTLVAFAALGLTLLLHRLGGGHQDTTELLFGLGLVGALVVGFGIVQQRGLFVGLARRLQQLAGGRAWLDFTASADAMDAEVRRRYGAADLLLRCAAWRMVGWLMGALEIWLVFYALGHPPTLVEVVILESLGQIARSAGFALPGGLGVQEGGLLAAAAWLGIDPDLVLAMALVRRGRELIFSVGGLLAWPMLEHHSSRQPAAPH